MFKPKDRTARDIPGEVYVALVDSLYSEAPFFLMGVLVAFSARCSARGWPKISNLYACAAAIILIGAGRAIHMLSYKRYVKGELKASEARRWETAYEIGTSVYVLVLGVWCYIAVAVVADDSAVLLSLSVCLAYIVGVTGRNFGSARLVWLQLVLLGAPMIAGLLVSGDIANIAIAVFLVPFLHGAMRVCDRLRNILFDAVIATSDVKLLADRFDTALNNMPHGLSMFDGDGKLLVINRRWVEIAGVDPAVAREGWTIAEVIDECVCVGAIHADETMRLSKAFAAGLAGPETGRLSLENGERFFDLTFQPMRRGGMVVLLEDVTAKKLAEARLAHMARYDTLTGLPNRVRFQERLDAVIAGRRHDDSFCVMFVDIDRFKQINDTLGHAAGDTLLFEAAGRLRTVVRDVDTVARFGADEFVVLQHPCRDHKEAAMLASRIIQSLAEPYDIDGSQVVIGASIGIAMGPQDGKTPDQLLKNADMALYRAKASGRGSFSFFESEMDTRAQARRQIEMDLRRAVANGELVPHYQPLYNLKQDRVSCCEALLRWPAPGAGHGVAGRIHPRRGRNGPHCRDWRAGPVARLSGMRGLGLGSARCGQCLVDPAASRRHDRNGSARP